MEKKRKNIIILCVLLVVVLTALIIFVFCILKDDATSNNLIIGGTSESSENTKDDTKQEINDIKENDNSTSSDDNQNIDNEVNSNNENNISTDEDVLEYFEEMEDEIDNSDNTSNFKEKFKEHFITVVDFIFYDKEIGGYTFNELGNSAKLKIIGIALKIDSKIEAKIPGYKASISSTGNKIYTNAKEKLVTLYFDISTSVCENNDMECAKAKEIFGKIKDSCKIGWSFIKGLISSGSGKLKAWYEVYSGK